MIFWRRHLRTHPFRVSYFAYNLFGWKDIMSARIDDIYLVTRRESKKRFRSRIYDAWGSKCAYCGEPAKSLDHVIPRHKGGLTVIENLVPACLPCNGHKGAENWVTWYRQQQFYSIERETMIWLWIRQCHLTDNALLTQPFLGLFSVVEQSALLASYAEIDNDAIDNELTNC